MMLREAWFKFAGDVSVDDAAWLASRLSEARAHVSATGHEQGCVLVFASFDGDEYTAARSKRKRIVGVPCLRQVLQEGRRQLPSLESVPVFCLVMEDAVLCGTGLSASEVDTATRQVGHMGGKFFHEFTKDVTHLLCKQPSPASNKYNVALRKKKVPIVTPQWVADSWDQQEALSCEAYRLPPFAQLRIAAIGLDDELCRELQQLVESSGGGWVSGAPDRKTTHALVHPGTDGATAARRAGLASGTKVVPHTWIRECVRLGGLVDETAPELHSAFVAFVTGDCPGNSASLVAQCRGTVTQELDKASVIVSPVGLVADSPLLRHRNLPIVTPRWLVESAAAGVVLPKERFAPTTILPPPVAPLSIVTPRDRGGNNGIGLFAGSSFALVGFEQSESQELAGLIAAGGGRLVTGGADCYHIVNDGVAVPPGCERKLSSSWLRVAAELNRAPEMGHFASQPFSFACPSVLMNGAEICTTGFADPERALLQSCISRLGATYGSMLRRRRTTHLVCKAASGDKHDAVVKNEWPVKLVSLEWLRQCCVTGRPPDAADYPVSPREGAGLLAAVKVFFSSAINVSDQRRYGDVLTALGGEVLVGWSAQVTHMVHVETSKRVKDLPCEEELARVYVVSPAWLMDCQKHQRLVCEDVYPASLNPRRNLGLSIVSASPTPPPPPLPLRQSAKRVVLLPKFEQTEAANEPFMTPMQKRQRAMQDDQSTVKKEQEAQAQDVQVMAAAAAAVAAAEEAEGLELEQLDGLVGAIRKFGHSSGGSNKEPLARQPSNSSGSNRSGSKGATVAAAAGSGGATVLKRAELKGSMPAPASLNEASEKEEEERLAKGVTYVDEKQLHKQRQALERSRNRGSGAAVEPPSSAKKKKYLDSSQEQQQSSVELESDSEKKRRKKRQDELAAEAPREVHFTLSKYDEQQKRELSGIIARLGGVTDDEFVPGVTTHVVVPVPSRSLKYLIGAASGVWVLRGEYLLECGKRHRYVSEEPFEWTAQGLPAGAVQTADKLELAEAPRKMRTLRTRGEPPLLHCVRCCFLGPAESTDTYRQLAEALGAVVTYSGSKPNWTKLGSDVTHVFCSSNYSLTAEDSACIETHRMACHMTEWIVQAIVRGRLARANEYVPTRLVTTNKRR